MPTDDGPRHHAYELACSFVGLDARHRDVIEEFVSWRNLEAMGRVAETRPARRPARTSSRKSGRTAPRRTARTTKVTARRSRVRTRGSSGR
jgi:hypothetical protein